MNTYIGKSKYGLGVFAAHEIDVGEIIERCPVLIYDNSQNLTPDDHSYQWGDDTWCINLGHGSIYNHSIRPNALYVRDYENRTMLYVSLCPIAAHEEILINYNGDIYSHELMWFETQHPQNTEQTVLQSIATKVMEAAPPALKTEQTQAKPPTE